MSICIIIILLRISEHKTRRDKLSGKKYGYQYRTNQCVGIQTLVLINHKVIQNVKAELGGPLP